MTQTQTPMALIRATFPRLRRTHPTAIVHSGGQQTVYGCLCGSHHTASTRHKNAAHVCAWWTQHATCAAEIADQIASGKSLRLAQVRSGARIGGWMLAVVAADEADAA